MDLILIKQLLDKAKVIFDRIKSKEDKGENFNIFEILNLSTYEAWLHTPLLRELLDPHGSHGLKDAFLNEFINVAQLDFPLDCANADVTQELSIGNISTNGEEGGRIDIHIVDPSKNSIIIENKIYAKDQQCQLLRYSNYAQAHDLNCKLLYLTLTGKEPSEESLGGQKVDYICISYRVTILTWLDKCLEIAQDHPLVREIIRQYSNCIKHLLNIMDTETLNQLVNLSTSPEFLQTTLDLFSQQSSIFSKIREDFIARLKPIAELNGFKMECDKGVSTLEKCSFIKFTNKDLSEHWQLCIGSENYTAHTQGVYWTILPISDNPDDFLPKLEGKVLLGNSQTNSYPVGWAYLKYPYWDWCNIQTLKDMDNGSMAKYIEKDILQKIKDERLLQEVEKLTY